MSGGIASPRKRRIELVKSEEVEPEGPKVHDFINQKGWRDGFLGGTGEGTLMQHHINSNPTLQRSGTDSSRSGKRNGSQSPGTPVARSPLQQPSNAPWNTHSSEEEGDSDEEYGNDPSASDGANNLWQKPLVKRISRIYKMGKSLRFSTHSSMSRRGGSHGIEEMSVPALPNSSEEHPELLGTSNSRKNAGVPMDTIDLGGTVFSFRPAAEQVLEKMDNFFPDHDLDKPIMDSSTNNTGTSGNNSGGSSPTMVDAPYSANLNVPLGSGANALTPTGSPILGGATVMASPSPMGITRQKQKKTIRTLAGQGKRKMDRLSKDGAASDTMLRRRSTKFWGNSIKELQPAEFEKLGTDIRNTTDLPETPESPGGSNKQPVVMQWFKGKLLGKGTYGKVYLGFNATTKEVFAVKRVEMPESRSDHQDPRQKQVLDAIKSESDTLRELDHPNIVAYLGYEQTEKYFSM
jgi:mitogen-activated protein kinase kinase kinase